MSEARLTRRSHYEVLGVDPHSTFEELRTAYRGRARECHPDVSNNPAASPTEMARLNEAWRVLSDDERRRSYDLTVRTPLAEPQPAPRTGRQQREAWSAGIRSQMVRLARQAGRSATQTMLTRQPLGARDEYGSVVDQLVAGLSLDIEARVRSARAAGIAPLDLAVAAILVGIRSEADQLRRASSLGIDTELRMKAELLDRMWDVLAHELPNSVPVLLGGNPNLGRYLSRSGL